MTAHFEPVDGYEANDPVCPECGRFAIWVDCDACGGEGYVEVYDDDPMWYDPGDTEFCHQCGGDGGWYLCDNLDCKRGVVYGEVADNRTAPV